MYYFFHPEVFIQFVQGYPAISIMIFAALLLHFLPYKVEEKTIQLITNTPLVGKAVMLTIIIWIATQVRSSDLQPFIYFQF
jgi:uncharacterized membrane protein